MREKQVVGMVAVILLVVGAIVVLGATAEPIRPPRLRLCPVGWFCGQDPPAGPAFTTDGDPESEAALVEIREVLVRHGCQVAVVERINEDGSRTPKLQVERVYYVVVMPERKP